MTGRPHTITNADGPGRSLTTGTETGPIPMTDLWTGSIGRREQVPIRAAGFWAAVVALVGAIGYILSVPLQVMSMLSPTQDAVVAFVSSLAIAPSFLVAVVALHYTVLPEKHFWTHGSSPACDHLRDTCLRQLRRAAGYGSPGGILVELHRPSGHTRPPQRPEPDPTLAHVGCRRARVHIP
jgi:hypothetical protein